MILGDVMDALAARLDTITGLRVFAYPPDTVTPPAAIVSYPDEYLFDETYGRGMDMMTLPVFVVVGKASARATRDVISGYVDGSGASSVKAVLESGTYTDFDTLRVASAVFDVITIGGTLYLSAEFAVEITGSGS